MARTERLQLEDGTWVGVVDLTAPAAIEVTNPEADLGGTLAEGFPSAADSAEDEELAEVRVVPARRASEPRPAPDTGGVLP